ncbi:MAG: hypothetical protein MJ187_04470 [Alphaproteobacteria bacterium]|nr:hypothetical protein [Alphaproteobacteria bacterium]
MNKNMEIANIIDGVAQSRIHNLLMGNPGKSNLDGALLTVFGTMEGNGIDLAPNLKRTDVKKKIRKALDNFEKAKDFKAYIAVRDAVIAVGRCTNKR